MKFGLSSFLYRLGHAAFRRRRLVLMSWLAALIAMIGLASAFGGETSERFTIPGTESQEAIDLLDERFPAQSGSDARVVFAAPEGQQLTDDTSQAAVAAMLGDVAAQPDVVGVTDLYADGTLSPDGTIGFADVHYADQASEVSHDAVDALTAAGESLEASGVEVQFGGDVMNANVEEPGGESELIGLAVAVVVLLISFGSVVAMGLPLLMALIGLGVAMSGITLTAAFVDLSSTAPILATMIGLAVGIDYALFIVTRHRQNLAEGYPIEEAAARANATAGGAVVFAGMTVVIALAGLAVVGIPFLTVMGFAAGLTVLVAIAIAITLIPALLGFAGRNIDRWRIGRARTGSSAESVRTLSARWAHRVTERPVRALVGGLAVMLLLAVPFFSMRTGMTDAGTNPPSTTQRQAYDLLADGFGPGFNGPLQVVVDIGDAPDAEASLTTITSTIAADPGVLTVGDPVVNPQADTAVIPVVPRTEPSTAETESLVHDLRDNVVPELEAATSTDVLVAGNTAATIDMADRMSNALPVFMLLVIGLTFLLLMVVFRSVLVPVKAAIAILLSIVSSFGVLVAVFQWGWLKDVIGLEETVPIVSFLPMIMFAILFGLSMDYEVFILSRVREDYIRTGNARASVLSGLTSSARVITAAALIMTSVFASFVLGDDTIIKMFGVGLSVAVLLDATIVRMMLVPATMALLDSANWWMPRWLDRLLPNVDIEGERLLATLDADTAGADEPEPERELEPA
jgi:putative drug exporter of the RND superfamily